MKKLAILRRAGLACFIGLLGSCLPDAGDPPDYTDHADLIPPVETLPVIAPDPFQPGDARLAVGLFYEGGRSETIPINGLTTNYFIFEGSYQQQTSTDRLEGQTSDELTLNGTSFWGGGIIWSEPIDLSDWTTMYVGFKSSDPSFENFDLTLQSGVTSTDTVLDPVAYGYTNDGEWHFLQIPLQDAIDAGFDPSTVRSPFIIGAAGGVAGEVLLVDNLYFTND